MSQEDDRTALAQERTDLAYERTQLANERTFLAWTRTGIANVGCGLAVIRFLPLQYANPTTAAKIVGSALVLLGILIFASSFFDYRNSLRPSETQTGYAGSLWFTSIISFSLIATAIVLLIVSQI